jgi:hypothetical protein
MTRRPLACAAMTLAVGLWATQAWSLAIVALVARAKAGDAGFGEHAERVLAAAGLERAGERRLAYLAGERPD